MVFLHKGSEDDVRQGEPIFCITGMFQSSLVFQGYLSQEILTMLRLPFMKFKMLLHLF